MQRLVSAALKSRSPFVDIRRFASTEELLRQSFFWKTPLKPEVALLHEKYDSTLFFSTHIEEHKQKFTYKDRRNLVAQLEEEERERVRTSPLPLALQYLYEDAARKKAQTERVVEEVEINEEPSPESKLEENNARFRNIDVRRLLTENIMQTNETKREIYDGLIEKRQYTKEFPNAYNYEKYPAAWMMDYENYDDRVDYAEKSQYGTPDPTIPVSKIECHGCGGKLQCADPTLPGYLPSELMRNQSDVVLRNLKCQRCHFLINYNTALNLKVGPEDYVKMIAEVKDKKGLVILMVDLLDFPCSIWPEMIDVVGRTRPLVLVGNKVDLLPKDSDDYLKHVKRRLEDAIIDAGIPLKNIKHTSLISAQTNYGVEDLITKLHAIWRYQGDVYLMGCTNVGKSTLFNALLRSDYCKVQASSIIKRATASIWPGTTLKMLKFPILRPTDKKLFERSLRLQNEKRQRLMEKMQLGLTQKNMTAAEPTMLIGHIGQTFLKSPSEQEMETDPFFFNNSCDQTHKRFVDENSPIYMESRWCYDTPGVIQPDQIVHLLTTEELMRVISKKILLPRSYYIACGMTLFLAGLGRIDYINGPERIRLSVFASEKLPVLIVNTHEADQIYADCIGTEILAVPIGDKERLKKFPALEKPEESVIVQAGDHNDKKSCADIVLSSAGWVSVNIPRETEAEFHVWTPECRGIFKREPALLPFAAFAYRGQRITGTPAYQQQIPEAFQK